VCGKITLCLLSFAIQITVDLGRARTTANLRYVERLRYAINLIASILSSQLYLRGQTAQNLREFDDNTLVSPLE
jgi:hypothetical protein